MDGEEERKSKQHRASRAGRGHDKKANKSEHSFHSEIDEKRQEKERAGNRRKKPKVKCNTFLIDLNAFQRLLEFNRR